MVLDRHVPFSREPVQRRVGQPGGEVLGVGHGHHLVGVALPDLDGYLHVGQVEAPLPGPDAVVVDDALGPASQRLDEHRDGTGAELIDGPPVDLAELALHAVRGQLGCDPRTSRHRP